MGEEEYSQEIVDRSEWLNKVKALWIASGRSPLGFDDLYWLRLYYGKGKTPEWSPVDAFRAGTSWTV